MKFLLFSLSALFLSFSACKKKESTTQVEEAGGGAPTSRTPWTLEQLEGMRENCVKSAKLLHPQASPEQSVLFCSCFFENAEKRWSFEEFTSNEMVYSDQLRIDGTTAACSRMASGQD